MSSFTIGSTIYTKLSLDGTLTSYVGTSPVRIFPDVAPLNVAQTFPYVVYTIISDDPTNTKGPFDEGNPVADGPKYQRSPLNIMRVQISSFSDSYETSMTIADRIRFVLDRGIGSGFTVGSGPEIDSIVYDGMSTDYESKISPQGVHNVTQEYIIRTINTEIASPWSNVKSILFDGIDDSFLVSSPANNTFSFSNGTTDSPFSFSLWINPPNVTGPKGIFSKNSSATSKEYDVMFAFNNFRLRLYDTNLGGYISIGMNSPLPTNTWSHMVVTYDGSGSSSGINIYMNGGLPGQTSSNIGSYAAMQPSAAILDIGSVAQQYYYSGYMDEFSVFNIELTAAQILAIYNAGTPTDLSTYTGLIGWWRMGDNSPPGSQLPNQTLITAPAIPMNIPASAWTPVTP